MSSSSNSRHRKRKREDKNEKRKRKRRRKEKKRKKKEKRRKNENDDDEVIDFSVSEAKKNLGLDKEIDVNEEDNTVSKEYMDFKKKYKKAAKKIKKKLTPELTCCLCLDILNQPVTASCGHSFCRVCLCRALAKMTDEFNHFSCPQCRKRLCVKCLKRFAVNKSLSTVLQTLFKQSKATEKEFAMFQVALDELKGVPNSLLRPSLVRKETFEIMTGIQCTRTVITDPDDPVMRFSLGLSKDFEKCFIDNSLAEFTVYFLQLEEDEDDQPRSNLATGFPALFLEPSIYQKSDFEKDICVKYQTQEDDSELRACALNGKSVFSDVFVHPKSNYVSIQILVPEYPELYMNIEIDAAHHIPIYRREVFRPMNQNYSFTTDQTASIFDEDVSITDTLFDAEYISDDDDESLSFIVNTDDEEAIAVSDDEDHAVVIVDSSSEASSD